MMREILRCEGRIMFFKHPDTGERTYSFWPEALVLRAELVLRQQYYKRLPRNIKDDDIVVMIVEESKYGQKVRFELPN